MSPWKTENGEETLGNLRTGCHAAVIDVADHTKGELRLRELGFAPGAEVEVILSGETLLVRLGEQRLCLRKDSADGISVTPFF